MLDLMEKTEEKVVSTKVSGKLSKKDVQDFFTMLDESVKRYGNLCLYIELENFQGWDSGQAFWSDLRLTSSHFNDVEKLAVVGEKQWEENVIKLSDYITKADIKFFKPENKEDAKNWLTS